MLRTITVILALAMVPLATAANAQGRRQGGQGQGGQDRREVARAQGVPPGQLPPANLCRVWYNGQPPGRQPRATSCQQAEQIAARDRNARVIYGENVYNDRSLYGNRGGVYDRNGGVYDRNYPSPYPDTNDRGVRRPGSVRTPNGSGTYDPYYGSGTNSRYGDTAFENGYRDGLDQGEKDGRGNDRLDPTRHGRYRSADRGYIDSYGDKNRYKAAYRDGFQAGYQEGYRTGNYRR